MALSVVLYKRLGVSNTDIALYTSWLYLPWVVKPLWSPLVELAGRKRRWVWALQFVVGAALASIALVLPLPGFFRWSLALFWLMAFASATHDIAADGFYMLALTERRQAAFVGVRSTFFRLANIAGQGGLVVLAGWIEVRTGQVVLAWSIVFGALGAGFLGLAAYHAWVLPRPAGDRAAAVAAARLAGGFAAVFISFFDRRDLVGVLAFLLLYRFAEAQLLKMAAPFLLDPRDVGGLGIGTTALGWIYGGVGAACLTAGGLLGGWWISRAGLRRCLLPMLWALHLPNLCYVALAAAQPGGLAWLVGAVALEQFGYGFGFAAYMMFMIWVAGGPDGRNPHRTAHYALATGFMALGMMLPGLWSGWLQSLLGYRDFFVWVCVAALPSFWAAWRLRLPADFGRRET
jgi:PAT family beta-lactamase induction signal transducer AmpG